MSRWVNLYFNQALYFFRTALGETPLELCVERELPGVIEVLCRKGADLCSSSKGGDPPLWKALQKNEDIASILVRYLAFTNTTS